MVSSISISRVIVLLLAVLIGIGTTFFYQSTASPEVKFWKKAVNEKFDYLAAMDGDRPKVVFVGGSSCSFSINVEQLKDEFGIQALNGGLLAGAGRELQLDLGLSVLRPGDTLVLAFETPDWGSDSGPVNTPMGSKLWLTAIQPKLNSSSLARIGREPNYQLRDLRVGGYHTATVLLKVAMRRPLYRYALSDIKEGGYLVTTYDDGTCRPDTDLHKTILSKPMQEFLAKTSDALRREGIQIAVSLPWRFTSERIAEAQRLQWQGLAKELSKTVTVLPDPNWGVATARADFADTPWHLSEVGATRRTKIVGESLATFLKDSK